jgi:hypothetical protein
MSRRFSAIRTYVITFDVEVIILDKRIYLIKYLINLFDQKGLRTE